MGQRVMVMKVTMKWSGPTPRIAKRRMNHIIKAANRDMGIFWWRMMRAKHFTHAGAREYGYTPRKGERGSGRAFRGSYTAQKLRAFGHTKPLVFTGTSEKLAGIRDVRATFKKTRVVIHARALNFRSAGSQVDMRAEMTAISVKDASRLVRVKEKSLMARLRQIRATETKHPG